ncbi:MAG: hypothetical protein R3304_12850, partial [Longimicrobiales bacterium]|nr:hypothetical protein [Longimicrobiales bacterium]
MIHATRTGILIGVAVWMATATAVEAQVSGRIILEEGPIGVDIVFGPQPSVVVEYGRRPHVVRRGHYEPRRPPRYRPGMSLGELERYMTWIESEYRYFRGLHPVDAWELFGW